MTPGSKGRLRENRRRKNSRLRGGGADIPGIPPEGTLVLGTWKHGNHAVPTVLPSRFRQGRRIPRVPPRATGRLSLSGSPFQPLPAAAFR